MGRLSIRNLATGLGALGLVTIAAQAAAQSCPVKLPTDGSPLAYRLRHPSLCEGTYTSPVSGGGMALVSFTFGRVAYDLRKDRELRIAVPGATADTQAVGAQIRYRHYYRLDAQLPRARPEIGVPLREVIANVPIPAEEFGVFGQRDTNGAAVGYVPVRAAPPDAPAATALFVVVQAGVHSQDVIWRLTTMGANPGDWQPAEDGSGLVPEGKTLTIPIGESVPGGKALLEVSYKVNGQPRTDPFVLLAP